MHILRWTARTWGVLALLLWGAFFVEHLSWFASVSALPPAQVFLLQGLHLLFLVGLAAGWRWERAGGLLALIAATAFFASTAGKNFPVFLLTVAVPAILWLVVGSRRSLEAGEELR